MSAVMKKIVDFRTGLPAVASSSWDEMPTVKQQLATSRFQLLQPVLAMTQGGVSAASAIENLLASIDNGQCDQSIVAVANKLGRKGQPPSKATLYRWFGSYEKGGLPGLVSSSKGRQRVDYGWEARALYWHQQPSKLAAAAIAVLLIEEKFEDVTESRVRRYLKSLPDDIANKKRIGSKFYRDTQMPSRLRNTDVLPVGHTYQGDGHTIDVYLSHPNTGKPWRPELTVWIDIRSRYIVGFYLTEAESSISTLLSLSKAMIDYDHVPACLHIDNGSGFKSQMMNDESVGFYQRFDITTLFALPGNSKGKGQVERFFRTLRDSFDKRWNSYCGHDMADEAIQRVLKNARQGKKPLPDVRDYLLGLQDWIDGYHHRPHRGIDGKTPAEMWSQLEHTQLHMTEAAVVRCQIKRTVRRGSLRLHNREYRHPELQQFNTREKLIIEYDLFDDSKVFAFTSDGRKICEPELTNKVDYLPDSRIKEMQQRRVEGQVKRLEKHIEEKRERSRQNIDHAALANQILDDGSPQAIEDGSTLLEHDAPEEMLSDECNDIDIFDIDYE